MLKISSFQHILVMIKTLNRINGAYQQTSALTHTHVEIVWGSMLFLYSTFLLVFSGNYLQYWWFSVSRNARKTLETTSHLFSQRNTMSVVEHPVGLLDATTPLIVLCFRRLPCFTFISFVRFTRSSSEHSDGTFSSCCFFLFITTRWYYGRYDILFV